MDGTETLSLTPAEHAVEMRIDIACPGCEYNLRGLAGPVVDCPECGLRSDVAVLATRQWTKPWYRAPGFNTLVWPAFVAFIWWMFLLPLTAANSLGLAAWAGMLGLGLVLWVLLMLRAYKVFDSAKGVWLALGMHLLVAGFLIGVFGLLITVLMSAATLARGDPVDWQSALVTAVVIGCLVLLLWICRRAERAIAGACIRQYLRRKPTR